MKNELTIKDFFKDNEFKSVRTMTDKDGEPWFVGKDVSKVLGYKETANMRKLLNNKNYMEIDPQNIDFTRFVRLATSIEPNKNIRRMLLINESGLYEAIFGSNKESAKRFQHWVTHEVLPSIRKYGGYVTDQKAKEILDDPDKIIEIAKKMIRDNERL
ncbi:BRO family protein [Anaerococcus vaginalis]|uniref:BRO-N domain-containing protein n=1 Tax=Anaerococcus vaginalis TaxID=33037 RepID=UPI002903FC0F|nr:BRO family protein [Anaerococcus vaginalis]MDU2648781.1 BRO family protein [Anaerococcus vaginalis]